MKEYFFKPNMHWNVISENTYNYLLKFYDNERLKFVETEGDSQ